jgi:inner membrane protein
MDVFTHGLAGAVMAQTAARPKELRAASGAGFLAGIGADADVFIRSGADPLLVIEFHRHFTHSLFFVPIGAALAALVLWPFLRRSLDAPRLYLFCLLGWLPSGFLDMCTSFGTYWLWPLLDRRLALNIMPVLEPVLTLMLLTAVAISLARRTALPARIVLGAAAGWLLIGWAQLQRAEAAILELAEQRGHAVERLVVKPTIGNLVLWRAVYQSQDRFYVDAIRAGASSPRVHAGDTVPVAMLPAEICAQAPDSRLCRDVARFARLSEGWVIVDPRRADVLGDVRYAMLPDSVLPLWGIEVDRERPERAVRFSTFREMNPADRQHFLNMLRGL